MLFKTVQNNACHTHKEFRSGFLNQNYDFVWIYPFQNSVRRYQILYKITLLCVAGLKLIDKYHCRTGYRGPVEVLL